MQITNWGLLLHSLVAPQGGWRIYTYVRVYLEEIEVAAESIKCDSGLTDSLDKARDDVDSLQYLFRKSANRRSCQEWDVPNKILRIILNPKLV